MKIISTLFLSIVFIASLNAQNVKILSKEQNEPLSYVTLISQNPAAMAVTNNRGEADVSAMENAEVIEVRMVGYKPVQTSYAEIKANQFTLYLTRTNITLQGVHISGTRWLQTTSESPERIVTLPLKEIELHNPQTAADLLSITGEVYIQKSQLGGGSPMIRGFSTNRLLYAIDGIRMNTAIFRSGNLQNVISLDGFAIENTEILFGPGSVIYGSDAIGAVMSFNTLSPQYALNAEPLITGMATARYTTASQEKTAHFHVHTGWKKWAAVTSFTSSTFDDLVMGSHGPESYLKPYYVMRQDSTDVAITNPQPKKQVETGYSQINLMQKVGFKPNAHWELNYGFHYSETSDVPRYDRLVRVNKGAPRHAEWYYGPQIWMMNHFKASYKNSHSGFDEVSLNLAHQFFEESRNSRNFNNPNKNSTKENVDALSFNLDLLKNLNPHSKLMYGLEYVTNRVASAGERKNIQTQAIQPIASRYPQSASWNSYAAYAAYQVALSPKFTLQAGARYNAFAIDADFTKNLEFYPLPVAKTHLFNDALTGSAGLTYHPDDTWALHANASTAFRAPNVDDIGKIFDSEPGSVVIPNTQLKAEYAYNAEIGIAKTINETVKMEVAAYYVWLENAMVRRDYLLNGADSILYLGELSKVQAIQNAAVERSYGVQAGVEIKLSAGFSVSSRLNYQVGEEELDNGDKSPARHAPPLYGMTKLNLDAGKLTLQLYADYAARVSADDMPLSERSKSEMYAQDGDGRLYSPGWYTLNIKAMYAINSTFTLTSGLENITDQRYRPYASGLVAPGRNMIFSVRANF